MNCYISSCDDLSSPSYSSLPQSSYEQLGVRVPEILKVLQKDKALSDMILDMINKQSDTILDIINK